MMSSESLAWNFTGPSISTFSRRMREATESLFAFPALRSDKNPRLSGLRLSATRLSAGDFSPAESPTVNKESDFSAPESGISGATRSPEEGGVSEERESPAGFDPRGV